LRLVVDVDELDRAVIVQFSGVAQLQYQKSESEMV